MLPIIKKKSALTQNDMTKCCNNYVAGMCKPFKNKGQIEYSNLFTPQTVCDTNNTGYLQYCQCQKQQGKLQ